MEVTPSSGPANGWTWADAPPVAGLPGQHIGPAQPGTALPPATPDTPVTLGEVMEDPSAAFHRIGYLIKRDLTDPRTWLSAAAMYFGPKAIGAVWPVVAKAASSGAPTQALGKTLQLGGRFVQSPMKTVGKSIESVGDRLVAPESTSPAAAAPAVGTPPVATNPGSPAPAMTAAPQSVAPTGKSPQQLLNEEALAARRLYAQLRVQGKTDAEAKAAVDAARALMQSGPFGHLPTDFDAAQAVTTRNASGRWPTGTPGR